MIPQRLKDFLPCQTPDLWLTAATQQLDTLLIDHANCEKKAASGALNLMFRYTQHTELLLSMSRLAREELRHFEQVVNLITEKGIPYRHLSASRYAEGLRKHMRRDEPGKLIDWLIIGALIEARSCERFAALAPRLEDRLATFYTSLLRSEARHFTAYLGLAEQYATEPIGQRIDFFTEIEADLITEPDPEFRFHSGPPINAR